MTRSRSPSWPMPSSTRSPRPSRRSRTARSTDRVFGTEFAPALWPAIVILAATVVGSTGSVAGAGLGGRGRPGLRSWAMFFAAIANIVVLVIMTPRVGALGGAFAMLAGATVAGTLCVVWLDRYFDPLPRFLRCARRRPRPTSPTCHDRHLPPPLNERAPDGYRSRRPDRGQQGRQGSRDRGACRPESPLARPHHRRRPGGGVAHVIRQATRDRRPRHRVDRARSAAPPPDDPVGLRRRIRCRCLSHARSPGEAGSGDPPLGRLRPAQEEPPLRRGVCRGGLDLVTADDDIMYPKGWLAGLIAARRAHPGEFVGYRAKRVVLEAGGPSRRMPSGPAPLPARADPRCS